MEKDIALGTEGVLKIASADGKITLSVQHNHASGSVSLSVIEDEKYFLELLRPHLPAWAQGALTAAEAVLP